MKRFFKSLIVGAAICFTFNVASALDIVSGGYIEVVGDLYPNGQDMNDSFRVAEITARRNLAEEIGELHISSSSTVNQFILNRDDIATQVKIMLQNSKVVRKYRDEQGVFHAVVRMPIYGNQNSLANVLLPTDVQVEDFPKPKMTNIESGDFNIKKSTYTGLIVDCRGLNIETAITPMIQSVTGETIYSYEKISRQTAVSRGMVAYTDNINTGINRAGANPLTVKAVDISGECDAVISQEDADKILIANQSTKFLNTCMVVIVR